MKTEFKIRIESALRPPQWFYCYAIDTADAKEQAQAFRPGAEITDIRCTGRPVPKED